MRCSWATPLLAGAAILFAGAAHAACDLRFEAEIPFAGPDARAHQLTTTIEGETCLEGEPVWRMRDPDGAEVWRAITSFDDLFPSDHTDAISNEQAIIEIYSAKTEDVWMLEMVDLPAWPETTTVFDFVTPEDALYGEPSVERAAWTAAQADRRRAWCWGPGTHYARCFWLTQTGALEEGFVLAW